MMRKRWFSLLTLTVIYFTLAFNTVYSQDIPDRPNPPRLVNDFARMLKTEEVNILERKLVAFNDSTSTQITIVTVPSLSGYDKSDYAQRLGEKWGIGQRGSNNGVLILVKPKTSNSNGEIFITAGYGLEGVIPDITCAEIVDYEVLPAFRNNDYFGGLSNATNTLMSLARGEFTAEQYAKPARKSKGKDIPVGVIIFIIIVIIAAISGKKGGSNNKTLSSGGLPLWLLLSMMGSGRGSHSGSWGGFSGGGSSGGGFGGFGGGSFGGGGAGGSW
jgi:uncharacterized protein